MPWWRSATASPCCWSPATRRPLQSSNRSVPVCAAVVKRSLNRFAADSLHPEQARELIRAEARAAVEEIGDSAPPQITLPATLSVRMRNPDLAEMATWVGGVVPDELEPTIVHITDDDPVRLYRTFITVVILTRGIAE